jgi:very-short-patch-repair endonuclease
MKRRYPNQTAKAGLWAKLEPEARRMRREPTEAEARLWEILKNSKLGVKFRRQHAIDRFIVDFISLSAKFIVEVDGEIHESQVAQDQERDAVLQSAGYRVVRYNNEQVLRETRTVIDDIKRHLAARSGAPSPFGEGWPEGPG